MDPVIRDPARVYEFFMKKASFPFFILKRNGLIQTTNPYTEKLVDHTLEGGNIQDIIVDFHGIFDLSEAIRNPDHPYLLNLKCQSGLPQTFYFNFLLSDDDIYVFGQPDQDELETIRNEILTLNLDLSNLTRELHKKNAQLKLLNEEKNYFLGMAAHDLRKPIGLIITYSEFLIEEAESLLDAEQIGFLNTINASSTFMKRLVDDFLDVSAIEAGKFELDLQPASIHEVLTNSLRLNKLQAVKKGIDLRVHSDKSLPRIILDASKIEQAITNLVSNAIEHTSPNSIVVITLSCDQQFILFSVKDEGPGIAPEEMDKLFKPFEKTSAKKTAGEKSTGLGMLISRKIIEAHKGEIWIDSKLGKGTTIQFKLPIDGEAS